jgi:superfamily II DNA or RNA helicase
VTPYIPYEDQRSAIDYILAERCVLLKAPTGAGKTLVGTQSALESGAKIILCIAPLNTISGWYRHVEAQYGEGVMPFRVINSKVKGKAAHADLLTGVPGFYIIGREYFKRFGWSKISGKCDFIIYDECHGATNRNSLMFKMLKTAKAPYKLAMSATPAGNKVEGLWSLARWLYPEKTERGFWNWITEFFHTEKNPYVEDDPANGKFASPMITQERSPGAVWASLPGKYRMKSVYKADPAIHILEVELSREQRKHYKDLETTAITWLEEHPLAVDIPPVLNMRLRQICLAVPSIKQDWVRKQDKDTGDWEKVWGDVVYFDDDAKSSKIDTFLELLSDLYVEKPFPILVFTDSRVFATMLAKRLQAKGYRARQFIGGMSAEERAWKLENFGKEFDIMVCTIPTVAEGTDGLQLVCHNEVWFNVSYNRLLNIQAQGRNSRTGQTKRVNRYLIQAKDTVEAKQHSKLKSDQDLMDASIEEVGGEEAS